MVYKILPEQRALSGDEILPHWALRNFGLVGDSIVSFIGDFNVPPERWIDLDSIMHGNHFPSTKMLHFIIEHFDTDLKEAVLRQYILLSILEEKLIHRISASTDHRLTRLGDDLFDGENRLSITAAGCTLVSSKIHLGVFIDLPGKGFKGLSEFGVDPLELAEVVICQYCAEMRRLSEKAWRMRPII